VLEKYKKSKEVSAKFTEKCAGVQSPTRQAIHNLNVRFEKTGRVADFS
jgi:hypothetical protein